MSTGALHQLDLCILAYQLYAQTLRWPFDPYGEELARPLTRRRELFLRLTRERFAAQGLAEHLDPILTDIGRIDPLRPSLFKPEADGRWAVFDTSPAITGRIGRLHIIRASGGDPPPATPRFWPPIMGSGPRQQGPEAGDGPEVETRIIGEGPDELACFEGVTGGTRGRVGNHSFLGFVLARDLADSGRPGEYEVHVAFRGSRSGWVLRSAASGFVGRRGNPDWLTAMDRTLHDDIGDADDAELGRSTRGIAGSLDDSLPLIERALATVARAHAPTSISVTGHSLGGALAARFAAAIADGRVGDPTGHSGAEPVADRDAPDSGRPADESAAAGDGREKAPQEGSRHTAGTLATSRSRRWSWPMPSVTTFSAPTIGDRAFRIRLEQAVSADRYYVVGDPVTSDRFVRHSVHVGTPHALAPPTSSGHQRARWKRPVPVSRAYHEPAVIRLALVRAIAHQQGSSQAESSSSPSSTSTGIEPGLTVARSLVDDSVPWQDFTCLADALADHPSLGSAPDQLARLLPDLGERLGEHLELVSSVLERRRAHPTGHRSRDHRRSASVAVDRLAAAIRAVQASATTPTETGAAWISSRDAIGDDRLHHFLGLALALAHLTAASPESVADLGPLRTALDRPPTRR